MSKLGSVCAPVNTYQRPNKRTSAACSHANDACKKSKFEP
jgi:hypothetical protein